MEADTRKMRDIAYTKLVFQNICQSMRAMTDAMKMLKIPYSNPQNEVIKKPSVFLMRSILYQQSYYYGSI